MTIDRKAAKAQALSLLKNNWTTAALVTFTFLVLSNLFVGSSYNNKPQDTPLYLSLISLLVNWGLPMGMYKTFLNLVDNGKMVYGDLFYGFKNYLSSVKLMVRLSIVVSLWTLLLVVPGVVKGIGYSMAFFLMVENPNLSAKEAMEKSYSLTMGHKQEIFMLSLSFLPWFILSAITLGIGFLWSIPYFNATFAIYYRNLKENTSQNAISR